MLQGFSITAGLPVVSYYQGPVDNTPSKGMVVSGCFLRCTLGGCCQAGSASICRTTWQLLQVRLTALSTLLSRISEDHGPELHSPCRGFPNKPFGGAHQLGAARDGAIGQKLCLRNCLTNCRAAGKLQPIEVSVCH